jgi:hypothetical protein
MSVADQIEDQMEEAQNYADQAFSRAIELNDSLKDALRTIADVPQIGYSIVNPPHVDATVNPADKPADLQITGVFSPGFELPGFTPQNIAGPADVGFKSFTKMAPILSMPPRPDALDVSMPDDPTINMPTIPDAPEYTLPDAPTIASIELPQIPEFKQVAEFNESFPTAVEGPRIPTMVYNEATYKSDLQDSAVAWIQDQIANGGTGLGMEVEQALFDRAVQRETDSARNNIDKVSDAYAASGFPRPRGSLQATRLSIAADLQNRTEELSREIMTEQARLAQTNSHFAIDKALQHEAVALQHFNSVCDRAFELAKSKVTIAIETYNAMSRDYQLRVEAFKSSAAVHEMLVRAAMLEADQYRVLLEGKKLESDIQGNEVELYRSQIEAANSMARFYSSQLEAAKIEADIEALELEVFKSQISAYVSKIQAKESEWSAYRAAIDGEKAKVDIFQAEVSAYQADTSAKVSRLEGEKVRIDAEISTQRLKLDQINSQIDLYKADIDKQKALISGQIDAYLAKNSAYVAEIDRAKAQAISNIETGRLTMEAAKFNANEMNNKFAREAEILAAQIRAGIDGTAKGSNTAGTLAASALSQINTIAQLLG